jgi:hypothetical protein
VTNPRYLTPTADPAREMPQGLGARLDHIHRALACLADEERRLGRLGFETPLARCHQARRFWSFVDGLHQVAAREPGARRAPSGGAW